VGSSSIGKMVKRVASALPGMPKRPGAGRFFYPRHGYGQISDALHRAAASSGARVELETNVTGITVEGGRVTTVEVTVAGERRVLPATYVLSTIPVTVLARLVRRDGPQAPAVAQQLRQRSMVLVYLVLDTDQFTEFDAHYFPEDVDPDFAAVRTQELFADARARSDGDLCGAAVRAGWPGMVDE
jgi:phytoene dehydrogenase-like protein